MTFLLLCLSGLFLAALLCRFLRRNPAARFRRRKPVIHVTSEMDTCASEPLAACTPSRQALFQKKPDWVSREIIRLSAITPSEGGQKIADEFNRLYGETKDMTVGKTWVCEQRKKHRYVILRLRRELKHRIPRPLPTHHTWAMDLTGLPDHDRQSHNVFGIIDHGSRGLLFLQKMQSKTSITLLRCLLDVIEHTGRKPKHVRTDNEAVFISRLFRFGLWWLGIKHQRSQPGHPWQNGRIERLFGTLKQKAKGLLFDQKQMQEQLHLFRFWYNHIRTHQHLHGKTPFEAYHQLPVTAQQADDKNPLWFEAWQGRLAGYWFKPG